LSSVTAQPTAEQARQHQTRALLLVLVCTVINAASQIFIKLGTAQLGKNPSMVKTALGIVTVPTLFAGYAMLGASTVLFVLALRKGDLSLLFPVFTLTYVWVAILSVRILHESMNGVQIAGLALIMGGVAVLGRASRQ
jgi:drug/metabolite transporter (DMT)-like permease